MIDYKTATRDQLSAEFERLKKLSNNDSFFTKNEFSLFPQIVMQGEAPVAVSSGKIDGKAWLIILTNQRIIFLDKGMSFCVKQVAIDLITISSICAETKILSGELVIATGEQTYTIENVPKKGVIPFANMIKDAVESLKQNKESNTIQQPTANDDLIEQLERLALLKERGILTEEEFQSQKDKILG